MRRNRLIVGAAVIILAFPVGEIVAQHTALRPTPTTFIASAVVVARPHLNPPLNAGLRKRMGPTSRGALIGGGIGLAASALAVVLYVEGTDPGNYSGAAPIVIGGAALGAVIGAAIGAGREPSVQPRVGDSLVTRGSPASAPPRSLPR